MGQSLPLLSPWTKTERGFVIALDQPSGAINDHLITSMGHVTFAGTAHWALIVEGPKDDASKCFYLSEDDVRTLEAVLDRARHEFGGSSLSSSALTATAAVAKILNHARAPALEIFVPRLVRALETALDEGAVMPVFSFLESEAGQATHAWWLAQALVGWGIEREIVWNTSALAVLRDLLRLEAAIEWEAAPSDFGSVGVLLRLRQKTLKSESPQEIAVLFDGLGQVGAFDGENWVIAATKPSAAEVIAKGVAYLGKKDMKAGMIQLEAAASIPGVDPIVHFHRGTALAAVGKREQALEAFTLAASRLNGRARMLARSNCATLLSGLGRRDAGLALLRKNVEEYPGEKEAWYALGLSFVKSGSYGESIAATKRALEIDAELGNGQYSIACAYALRAQSGDVEHALTHIKAALACDPDLRKSIAEDEDFGILRQDPRFVALLTGDT